MSDYFGGYQPTFKFMGQTFSGADRKRFEKFLQAHGRNFATWAANHPKKSLTFDPVSAQVYSAYAPQVSAMERMKADLNDTYANRFKNLGLFTNSLVGMLGNIPGYIAGPYAGATNAQLTAGNKYGEQLNLDSQGRADAANKTLQAIGAPDAQTLQGGDAGGALAGLAGWLPSQMLNAQGEAYVNRANHLPVEAQLTALQMAKDLFDNQGKDTKELDAKMEEMLMGIPGDRAKIVAANAKQALAAKKLKLDTLDKKHKWLMDKAKFALSQGHEKAYQHYKQLAAQVAQQRADIAGHSEARQTAAEQAREFAKQGYAPDGKTLLPGFMRLPNGTVVPRSTGKGSVTDSPPRLRKSMVADLKSFNVIKDRRVPGDPSGKVVKRAPTYSEAFTYLYQKYKGYMKKLGGERKYDKMIDNMLRAAGILSDQKPATGSSSGKGGAGGKPVPQDAPPE